MLTIETRLHSCRTVLQFLQTDTVTVLYRIRYGNVSFMKPLTQLYKIGQLFVTQFFKQSEYILTFRVLIF